MLCMSNDCYKLFDYKSYKPDIIMINISEYELEPKQVDLQLTYFVI